MRERKTIIRVPSRDIVFVLEDSASRLRWFIERLQRVRYFSNVEDAPAELTLLPRFPLLFLDHDLNWRDAAGHKPGSGVRVAYFLARIRFAGRVVIHSVNEEGAAEMKHWLPDAEVHPFGTFEIEIV